MLSRFHLILDYWNVTDGRTDRQTDRIAISVSRISVLTRNEYAYSTFLILYLLLNSFYGNNAKQCADGFLSRLEGTREVE